MSTLVLNCPSGMIGEARGLKGKEAQHFNDRKLVRSGQVIDKLLQACWIATTDFGPYDAVEEGKTFPWLKALSGDRFYAFIQIRIASFGPNFDFDVQCRKDQCRSMISWRLDLNELPTKVLSESDRECFRLGNKFETKFPGTDLKVIFKLPLGEDEVKAIKNRNSRDRNTVSNPFIDAVLLRTLSVEGVETRNLRKFFEEADLSAITDLIAEYDERDCGIDTDIEIECQECGLVQRVEVPFGDGFLVPSQRKKTTKDH